MESITYVREVSNLCGSNMASTDIRIELQHGATTVQIRWPLQASGQCAQWLREVLA